ncbi:MAG TPA: MMPL family transporter, partial [Candidatus Limnocylindrales bacterium]
LATINQKQKALDAGRATIAANQRKLDAGKAKLAAGQKQFDAGKAKLDAGQKQLDAGKATLAANQKKIDDGLATIAQKQAEIDAGRTTIAQKQAEIDAAPATIAANEKKLENGATLLDLSSGVRLVSDDGSAAVAPIMFAASGMTVPQETKDGVMAAFTAEPIDGVSVDFSSTIAQGIPNLIGGGELVGLVVAAIVLFVMLGTLIGAGLPILTALLGVGIGALGALALSGVVDMVSVTPILGMMLGLAVGIDYALFIVNRHRRQLKDGYEVAESIALANGTSGNAVLFAGSTVIIALLALNVTGIPFLGLMGTVGAACVAIAVLIAITLTPALLSLVGTRILRRSERTRLSGQTGPAAVKPAQPISTRGAVVRVIAGIAVLVLVAVPATSLRLGLPVGSADAADSTQHRAYDVIDEKFGAGTNGPLLVVADLPGSPTEDQLLDEQVQIAKRLAAFDGVAAVAPVGSSADRTVTAFQVVPTEGPTSVSTERLVNSLRAASPLDGGIALGVAGQATGNIDISAKLSEALPLYLTLVVGLSLLIMVVVFRSLFVPIVATGGFVLSLFAALGGVVAIFQWGWLGGLFGVSTPAPIINFLPTLLVGVLFGLAMDYMLFLATGMREAYAHGAPAKTAVVLGVRAGRSVVVAAAIIMISVFGGFVFSDSAIIRPMGFALAFGVLVDAFFVRLLIMPALMSLAGDWAWWLPKWLDRLIPNVDVEGASLERRHPHVASDHREQPAAEDGNARLDQAPA